MSRLK